MDSALSPPRRRSILLAVLVGASVATCLAGPESPPAPWAGDFAQAWELTRDHFHDPALGGVDWTEARQRHEPAFLRAATHGDAARAINAMLAELATSHTQYYTADDPAYYFLLDLFREAAVGRVIPDRFPGGEVSHVGIGLFTAENVRAALTGEA